MNNTMSMFCISSPMPVKMLSSLKKSKLPEVGLGPQLGEKYQAKLPALLSNKVSSEAQGSGRSFKTNVRLFRRSTEILSPARIERAYASGPGDLLWMGKKV